MVVVMDITWCFLLLMRSLGLAEMMVYYCLFSKMSGSNLRKVPLHVATPHPRTPKQILLEEKRRAESILLEEKRLAESILLEEKRRAKSILFKEKVKEDRKKLMENFQAILTLQVGSIWTAILGVASLGRLDENFQSKMSLGLLIIALICTMTMTFSYTVKVKESLSVISAMTRVVTISCAFVFHFAVFLLTPEDEIYTFLSIVIFLAECLFILSAWNNHFPIPSGKRVKKLRRL